MQSKTAISDAELIHSFIQGDNSSLEPLAARYKNRIFTAIYLLVKDKYLAEDILQDAFVKIIQTFRDGRYNEQGKFLPWALRVAHNLCIDHFRKVRKSMPVTMPDGEEIALGDDHLHESHQQVLERKQTHRAVRELVADLPEEQREVVVLRMFSGLSFKEIAGLTGVSVNTALGRMRYGLINLRKMMDARALTLR